MNTQPPRKNKQTNKANKQKIKNKNKSYKKKKKKKKKTAQLNHQLNLAWWSRSSKSDVLLWPMAQCSVSLSPWKCKIKSPGPFIDQQRSFTMHALSGRSDKRPRGQEFRQAKKPRQILRLHKICNGEMLCKTCLYQWKDFCPGRGSCYSVAMPASLGGGGGGGVKGAWTNGGGAEVARSIYKLKICRYA